MPKIKLKSHMTALWRGIFYQRLRPLAEEGTMVQIKGNGLIVFLDYLTKKFGENSIQKICQTLDPADQEEINRPIAVISWVNYGAYMRFLFAADKVFGLGDKQLIIELQRYAAQRDFKGIYKMLLSVLSLEIFIKNVPRAYRAFFRNAGEMTVEQFGNGHGILKVTNAKDMPLGHEWDNIPYLEEVLRLNGTKNPRIQHTQCVARGDQYCIFDVNWD